MKKRKYKKSTLPKELKEPETDYTSFSAADKKFMVFKSFEEADEFHYRQLAMLTPQEHLSNALQWIKRLYADDLKKNPGLGTNFRMG